MFLEKFAFRIPASINFVGGGGKTALILSLAEEFSESVRVIYTTTTRIHPPHPRKGLAILSGDDPELLRLILHRAAQGETDRVRTFVVTGPAMTPDLLKGVAPEFGRSLDRAVFPVMLNEADGARSMSLKMPREGEPVLMANAEYLVPVLGLDCVNQRSRARDSLPMGNGGHPLLTEGRRDVDTEAGGQTSCFILRGSARDGTRE